ncbi:MAG: VCBS repeat-containing protein [Planctomycetes bacterium]|nr:VCBS repeat-containing protein [Planctomycetota bacterium]MBI3843750.1 VCBS repeat-containing protein [Planctomycetota bacterium]
MPSHTWRLLVVGFLGICAFGGSSAWAQVDFDTYRLFEAGMTPVDAAAADFDRDGALDLAVADLDGGVVTILFGDGWGEFPRRRVVPVGTNPVGLVALDANEDSRLDLAVADLGTGAIAILLGDGAGSFTPAAPVPTLDGSFKVVSGDIDGDGHADLATSDFGSGRVEIFFGDGTGAFRTGPTPTVAQHPEAPVDLGGFADLDEDGHLDLLVSAFGGTIAVFLSDGHGNFLPPLHYSTSSGQYLSVVSLADVDGDGHIDVLGAATLNDTVFVMYGGGFGDFRPAHSFPFPSPNAPNRILAADVDQDGHLDLVSSGANTGTNAPFDDRRGWVQVRRGLGARQFSDAVTTTAGVGSNLRVISDVDADGWVDLVVANEPTHGDGAGIALLRGASGGSFVAGPSFQTCVRALSVFPSDFDGDGQPDVAVACGEFGARFSYSHVSIQTADGSNRFFNVDSVLGARYEAVTAVDFDRDGILDVAATGTPISEVTICRGTGGGTFALPVRVPTGNGPSAITSADIDEDGWPDLLTADSVDGSVTALLNDGSGGVGSMRAFAVGDAPRALIATDLDGDGHVDLVVANESSATLSILLGDGHGGMTTSATLTTDAGPHALAVGDFDRDGSLDFVVANHGTNTISLFPAHSPGVFGPRHDIVVESAPGAVAALDLDEDGNLDLVVALEARDTIVAFAGDGAGGFRTAGEFGVQSQPSSLAIADYDADGHADVAVANYGSFALTVLHDRTFGRIEYRARAGSVNAGAGAVASVLYVNDSAGVDPLRAVDVGIGAPFVIAMSAPPARPAGPSPFALYLWNRVPTFATVVRVRLGLGVSCLPMPLHPSLSPQPIRRANNIGHPGLLGAENWPQSPTTAAPSVVLSLPGGVHHPATVFLQGLIVDSAAPNGRAAVTNGVLVRVR